MSGIGLEVVRLWKRYGDVVAVRDMTFTVAPGELFGFVGANGAGKTTTMRIALGVLAADAGKVRWHGRPLDLEARRRVGYMPEERGLYPRMRVLDQLAYLAELHGLSSADARDAAQGWLERLGVADRAGDEVQKLSLGNQQRIQLAAALVHDPEILILDEPFSGLDPVAVDVMSEVLRERCDAGVPVIFSSHQLQLVEALCDRVGIVRDGEMVAVGSVDELRSRGERRLEVVAPAATDGWASTVSGASVAERDGARWTLTLADGVDDQAVLAAALATGPVHEFVPRRASLTELFRDVVADGRPTPATAARPSPDAEPAGMGPEEVRA
jgi:ABC-2 type transport system ATP-binding protein